MRSGSRQRAEEGEGLRVQVHEQRGHHRGVRQKPASNHQDGLRQRAEARRDEQVLPCHGYLVRRLNDSRCARMDKKFQIRKNPN